MTLPHERTQSIRYAKEFLIDLSHHSKTKRIPSEIRQRARRILRHWPFDFELEDAFKRSEFFVSYNRDEVERVQKKK